MLKNCHVFSSDDLIFVQVACTHGTVMQNLDSTKGKKISDIVHEMCKISLLFYQKEDTFKSV